MNENKIEKKENRFEIKYKKLKEMVMIFEKKISLMIGRMIVLLLLVFLISESIFSSVYFVYNLKKINDVQGNDLYKNQPWLNKYNEERKLGEAKYSPYIGYKSKEFSGKYINIGEDSLRSTFNTCNTNDSKKFFMFGGSTLWGEYARDNYTIPSYFSKKLCSYGMNIVVSNFGSGGYTTSEEMITLIMELRKGNIPDYVIFYDGVNDVGCAYLNNKSGYPPNAKAREDEFNLRKKINIIEPFYQQTSTGRIIAKVFGNDANGYELTIKTPRDETNLDKLSNETAEVYLNNLEIIEALSSHYNFTAFYFLQPNLYTKKELSSNERILITTEEYTRLGRFYNRTYDTIVILEKQNKYKFYDIRYIFNEVNGSVYYDTSHHISEEGNRIVGERIAEIIYDYMMGDDDGTG
jgi:lysophospholipase L1-like esterase